MTTTNTTAGIDLDKLEALARAATPGPWLWWTSNSYMRLSARGDGDVMHGERLHDGVCTVAIKRADAAFTEALDPATVLQLIELARKAISGSDGTAAVAEIDRGPWRYACEDGKHFVESGDFTHDVRLYINGDFAHAEDREAYGEMIARQLNSAAAHPTALTVPAAGACQSLADERASRAGRNLLDFAVRVGWDPDGDEGAFEFVQRATYEVGYNDAKQAGAHHLTPENVAALISDLKSCEAGSEVPSIFDRDWRTQAGIIYRVIEHLLEAAPAPAAEEERDAKDAALAEHYRNAIAQVCEGWTLPASARKVLEAALWSEPASAAIQSKTQEAS